MINKVVTKDEWRYFDVYIDMVSFLFASLVGKTDQKVCVTAQFWQRAKAFARDFTQLLEDYGVEHVRRGEIDRLIMTLPGNNVVTFMPVMTGDKIRGLRANIIIFHDVDTIPTNTIEEITCGYMAVSDDPIGDVKKRARYHYEN